MRKTIALLALGTAVLTAPAFAQSESGTAANPGTAAAGTPNAAELKPAAREDVRAGAQISDSEGNSVGTVQSIDGDNAVVVDSGKLYNVPLSSLYSHAEGAAQGLVTKLPRAELKPRAPGGAETR